MDNRFVENGKRKTEYLETQQLNVGEGYYLNEVVKIRDWSGDLKKVNWFLCWATEKVFDLGGSDAAVGGLPRRMPQF